MKKIYMMIMLIITFATFANANESFKFEKMNDNVYVMHGPVEEPNEANKGFMNNPAFVITDKSVIVLDPGSSLMVGKALIKRIRKLTKNPITHVFNSHVHGDHWLANQAFVKENKDVKIHAHPNMIEEAKNGEAKVWIDMMMDRTKGITKDTIATIPTEVLKDQQEIKVDNITIKAHLANIKAHTDTDAMFEIVEELECAPDYHCLPVGNAGNITAYWMGYKEYRPYFLFLEF